MSTRIATKYTAYGNVRGWCGHRHRTWETAQRCADADNRDCRGAGGGYSDRYVYFVDQMSERLDGSLCLAR